MGPPTWRPISTETPHEAMAEIFLDTYAVEKDQFHRAALELANRLEASRATLVTTQAILLEIGNFFARPPYRSAALALLGALHADPSVLILPIDETLLARGEQCLGERADKTWGLTGCISFTVMQDRGITAALTADLHFEQAGFQALLRQP
jgi:uncharacterized protein